MADDVIIIQHAAPEGPGRIGAALAAAGLRARVVRADLGEPIPQAAGAGLVVLGGPMGVYEAGRFPHLADELRLIAAALAAGAPVLGICLGAQLLAAALGADVRPGPAREIGWADVTLLPGASADPLLGPLPARFPALHWHGDVFALPDGAVPLARTAPTPLQAFRYGAHAWGLLFHLEADAAQTAAMAAAFPDELADAGLAPDALARDAAAHEAAVGPLAAGVFGRWADVVAQRA